MEKDIQTQLSAIRHALLNGKQLTPIDALNLCGCFRLSARIYDLRNNEGLPIEMVKQEGTRYATYYISAENLLQLNKC